MVHMANLGKILGRAEPPSMVPSAVPAVVKLEIEDELEDQHGPLHKRPKSLVASSPFQQWDLDAGMVPPQSVQCSLLNEPSPLGLRLKKSPSFLDMIQTRLSEGNSAQRSCATGNLSIDAGRKKDLKSTIVSGATDKLKASNFPASLLRIGSWECVSRYEGDLVAKCYYAKHKLVWEVLDGGLKSKIEIQWSDITALKAICLDNGPETLDIVLTRQPLFFRETNPQPRKHTLWQATSDFTNGQASIHRRHFLQCPPGLLSKHFEKLIQCDPRLNSLSQQPEIILESPFFEPRCSVFEDHEDSKVHVFGDLKDGFPQIPGFQDSVPPCADLSAPMKNDIRVPVSRTLDSVPQETLSPSSVMDSRVIEDNPTSGTKELTDTMRWDQIKVPGLRSSMSVSDLVNHISHCMSGQTTPGNPLLPTDSSLNKSMLEELTQYLLSDSQVTSASDENSLMSRVNSLCCLIQHKDPAAQTYETEPKASASDTRYAEQTEEKKPPLFHVADGSEEPDDSPGQRAPGISRKESFGELLMNLPRITSLPQFLFNIVEDSDNQAR